MLHLPKEYEPDRVERLHQEVVVSQGYWAATPMRLELSGSRFRGVVKSSHIFILVDRAFTAFRMFNEELLINILMVSRMMVLEL